MRGDCRRRRISQQKPAHAVPLASARQHQCEAIVHSLPAIILALEMGPALQRLLLIRDDRAHQVPSLRKGASSSRCLADIKDEESRRRNPLRLCRQSAFESEFGLPQGCTRRLDGIVGGIAKHNRRNRRLREGGKILAGSYVVVPGQFIC